MFYIIWIISAFTAVGLGLFTVFKLDKRESANETTTQPNANR